MSKSPSISYTGTKDKVVDSALKESTFISVIDIENAPGINIKSNENSPPKKPKQFSRPLPVAF